MNFKQHYENTRSLFSLRRLKDPKEACPLPHNMPVWHDINEYFKQLFRERTQIDSKMYTVDGLISDLEAWFHGKYDRETIEKMLKIGYTEVSPGCFEFNRKDFLPTKNSHGSIRH